MNKFKFTYEEAKMNLLGKKVHFKAKCVLFPNFEVTGKVISVELRNGGEEIVMKVSSNGRHVIVGSNMSSLQYELLEQV